MTELHVAPQGLILETETKEPKDTFDKIASVIQFPDELRQNEERLIEKWNLAKENIKRILEVSNTDNEEIKSAIRDVAQYAFSECFKENITLENTYQGIPDTTTSERYKKNDPYRLWGSLHFIQVSREKAQVFADIMLSTKGVFDAQEEHPFQRIVSGLQDLQTLHEIFPQTNEVLVHSGPSDTMAQIVTSGLLASKKEQLERFGKAQFTTGGVEITKLSDGKYKLNNKIAGSTQILTQQELFDFKVGSKLLLQEAHDICFNTDSIYWGYQEAGVYLVFDKAQAISNTQIMESDGLHVYDGKFEGSQQDPGFNINLEETDYIAVVDTKSEHRFITSLLEIVAQGTKSLEEVISWYTQHVLRCSSVNIQQVQEFFFKDRINDHKIGTFLPTKTNVTTPGNLSEVTLARYAVTDNVKTEKRAAINNIEDVRQLFAATQEKVVREKIAAQVLEDSLPKVPW